MTTTHLSQIDLANRWRMSPRTLERWRFTGEGPQFIKIGGQSSIDSRTLNPSRSVRSARSHPASVVVPTRSRA